MSEAKPDRRVARVPFAMVLASIVGLWACYFLLTTLRAELLDLEFFDAMLWRRVLATCAGIAVTLGLWLILRAFDMQALWVKIVAALIFEIGRASCRERV